MAITYVGAGVAATGEFGTLLTPGLPAGLQAGDLILGWVGCTKNGFGATNVGETGASGNNWPTRGYSTLIPGTTFGPSQNGMFGLFGRIAGPGETAPTIRTDSNGAVIQLAAFRGAALGIIGYQVSDNASAQNIAFPGLTISKDECIALILGFKIDDWTSVNAVSGFTEIGEPDQALTTDGGIVWGYRIQTSPTNITAGSFVVSGGAAAVSAGISAAIGLASSPGSLMPFFI
jgi:hypothetical protein